MPDFLTSLPGRLEPVDRIFFTWLPRVCIAAVLVGAAWIDDAPPLELGAMLIAFYVAARIAMQFKAFADAAPFANRVLSGLFALGLFVLLGFAFIVVVIFVDQIALAVVNGTGA